MRLVYLDEAGISDREPFAVVCAVVVDSDRQLKGLEAGLSDLADKCAPPGKRRGFIFHATELYGGGKTLVRGESPPEHGRGFLKTLLQIPADNGMEVAMHFIEKAELTGDFRPSKASERAVLYHTMAFIGCAVGIEMLMRTSYPNEVAHLVAEDNSQSRRLLRDAHNFLKNAELVAALPSDIRGVLPFQHIVDGLFFAEKTESSALQLADACAFTIRRHLECRNDAAEYYDLLVPALINRPKTDVGWEVWAERRP